MSPAPLGIVVGLVRGIPLCPDDFPVRWHPSLINLRFNRSSQAPCYLGKLGRGGRWCRRADRGGRVESRLRRNLFLRAQRFRSHVILYWRQSCVRDMRRSVTWSSGREAHTSQSLRQFRARWRVCIGFRASIGRLRGAVARNGTRIARLEDTVKLRCTVDD
jgi:hypothetical protein